MAWKIKFTIGGYWHNGLYTTKIFISDDNLCKIVHDKANSINIRDRQFSEIPAEEEFFGKRVYSSKISDAMLAEFNALNIFSWDSFYGSRFILDGTHWALALTDGNRRHRCIGLNGYPKNFEDFQAWLKKIWAEASK